MMTINPPCDSLTAVAGNWCDQTIVSRARATGGNPAPIRPRSADHAGCRRQLLRWAACGAEDGAGGNRASIDKKDRTAFPCGRSNGNADRSSRGTQGSKMINSYIGGCMQFNLLGPLGASISGHQDTSAGHQSARYAGPFAPERQSGGRDQPDHRRALGRRRTGDLSQDGAECRVQPPPDDRRTRRPPDECRIAHPIPRLRPPRPQGRRRPPRLPASEQAGPHPTGDRRLGVGRAIRCARRWP